MGKRSRDDGDEASASRESSSQPMASPAKVLELEQDLDNSSTMQCSLSPHRPLTFSSAEEFDLHYAKEHTNRCSSCGKNFPSAHYLALHVDENHNPVREALAARGEKTYACFIEDCDRKCSNPQKRRLHLIDRHMFPKVYNFRIIDQGIDRANSLLQTGQKRRLSTQTSGRHHRRASLLNDDTDNMSKEDAVVSVVKAVQTAQSQRSIHNSEESNITQEVDALETSLAALKFVPPSVQARRRGNNK